MGHPGGLNVRRFLWLVLVFACGGIAGYLFCHHSGGRHSTSPVERRVILDAPNPARPGSRTFTRLVILRAYRSSEGATTFGPVPNEPGDRDWVINIDGNCYFAQIAE